MTGKLMLLFLGENARSRWNKEPKELDSRGLYERLINSSGTHQLGALDKVLCTIDAGKFRTIWHAPLLKCKVFDSFLIPF